MLLKFPIELIPFKADLVNQNTECMEEAARIIAKAFTFCVVDRLVNFPYKHHFHSETSWRTSPAAESRKWGVYYVVGLVMQCYFRVCTHLAPACFYSRLHQVKRIGLSRNILRALDANKDIPPLSSYPRAHQVREYPWYWSSFSHLIRSLLSIILASLRSLMKISKRLAVSEPINIGEYLSSIVTPVGRTGIDASFLQLPHWSPGKSAVRFYFSHMFTINHL